MRSIDLVRRYLLWSSDPGLRCSGVNEKIHDDEPDTGEPVVRLLLDAECPQWAKSPVEYLRTSGTDNAMWRVRIDAGPDVVVRLPRRPKAAAGVLQETAVLQQIERAWIGSIVKTPKVLHVGEPHEAFAHHWSVLEWIDGSDAWTLRNDLDGRSLDAMAADLADAVTAIGAVTAQDARPRSPGSRGGPLRPLLKRLDGWLASPEWNAANLLDVGAVRRLASEALEVVDEPVIEGFVHGDLIPGNLLVEGDRLTAIIDWGGAGRGDTAQDLAPAWAVLTASERSAFKVAVGADDAAWIRGRTFELEHAVGGVLYYVPKHHALGDVMTRTLDRILESP
jgi:aminoglycoside phosphotransferase (APT) family kinase protein